MNSLSVSATYARNNFFDLLNQVASGLSFTIKKDNKEVAIFSPKPKKMTDVAVLTKTLEELQPFFKNYDPSDNPLRRPGANAFLGRWDKDL